MNKTLRQLWELQHLKDSHRPHIVVKLMKTVTMMSMSSATMKETIYNHGFGPATRSGRTNVHLRVTGQSSKRLVLVFVSYEPVNWILNIDFPGRVVYKVLLVRL